MSCLYIVPTPIGNMEDITLRAIRILKEVDIVLAEDTRHSRKLLQHYEIDARLVAYHQHNEHKITPTIVDRLAAGERAALISDAGTPGISDPGYLLCRACIEKGVEIQCLPGATAFVPALVQSGIPCDRFLFEGFLPHKKGRHSRLQKLRDEERTIVLYESPHRLHKTLVQLAEYLGEDRQVAVAREMTKKFEETLRGSLSEVIRYVETHKLKGEFVLVIGGRAN